MDRRRGCQIPLHYSSSSSSCLPSQPPLVQPSSMAMSPFHDDQEYRYSGRVRMRKWLINQVSSGRYIGLKWIDKDKTLLRIPWKHGSRSGWSVEDGKLFESWAVQSGKFDPLHPNTRKWKANFRCALRSLPDVDEVKNLSHKTGKDAYKIFKFLPEKQRKRCYKSSRPWRQPQSKAASSKQPDAYDRPDAVGSIRPKAPLFGRAQEPVLERKPHPSEMLHPAVAFPPPPPPPSSEDHRRCYYPLGVLSDVRHSPPLFWVPTQPPPMPPPPPSASSLCSSASEIIGSAFSADIGTWPFRNQPPLPPPPPPNVSASMGFAVGVPFEELPPCDQYSNSFGSSPLVADPPSHPQYRNSAALGSQPSYSAACDAYPSGSADYSEMTAYEAPYFSEHPSQSEMTDISNLPTFPPWPNATENFMAEVFDVMQQQVLRDRCGMSNEDQYGEDVEQYEVKVIHP